MDLSFGESNIYGTLQRMLIIKEKMEASQGPLPLNIYHVQKLLLIINRLHMFLHSTALGFLFYYRVCFLFQDTVTRGSHLLPWLLVFASEIIISFIWLLGQAFRWRPILRSVFPERLPEDDKLPAVDVFICTADPIKEPTLQVMNTVLSSMALDYPQEKLHVYLSDDGCSPMTLYGLRKAFEFAKWWLPFCRRYRVKNRCPKAYFSGLENDDCDFAKSSVYMADKKEIKGKYDAFKEEIETFRKASAFSGDSATVGDHSSVIEVMQENDDVDNVKMPLLVYVSREKKPSNPHHFKAGALNVLLRVSAVMSNSPYILVLDCDMFCNDPTSARYAMCFHLDPKISSSLSFVQFPQRFHNISKNDIYDSQLRSIFTLQWQGMDGLNGPVMSGTGFYIKRISLYGIRANEGGTDLLQHQEYFGSSNEFIKSLTQNYTSVFSSGRNTLLKESHLLASCRYDVGTKWGQYVGFLYDSVVEDFLTGFILHCNGWTSVYSDPSRPHFLGTATTNLNDVLIQGTRWYSGLFENGISKFCPLVYGTMKMPLLQSLCFVELTYFPLYCLPLWCFAIIPQLCLLNGVTLYPKVSDPFFIIFVFIFVSSLSKHLLEVFLTGGTLQKWINEQRIWMMRSTTCHLYGCLDALLKKVGIREASFLPTNKAEDDEQTQLYQLDKYDFRALNIFIVPILALLTVNIFCFVVGVSRVIIVGDWDKMFMQLALAGFIIIVNYPIIEGLVIRKDKGRISQSLAIRVILATMILLASMNCYKMHNML